MRLERAEKHFLDFETALGAFRKDNPCAVRVEGDVRANKLSYYVVSVPEIPNPIRLLIGDALHNLRSTLDYLIWAIVKPLPGSKGINQIGFPILDTAAQYEEKFAAKVPGAGKALKKAIDGIAPYKAGNIWLWRLHHLNIRDKHRLLLTAAFVQVGRSRSPLEEQGAVGFTRHGVHLQFVMDRFPPVPLKAGDKLFTVPHSQAKEYVQPVFDISFGESGVSEGIPIYLDFKMMHAEVRRTILTLARFIKAS